MLNSTPHLGSSSFLKLPNTPSLRDLKLRKSVTYIGDIKQLIDFKKMNKQESLPTPIDTHHFLELVKKNRKTEEDIKTIKEELSEIQFFKNISSSLSEMHLNLLIKHSTYEFLRKFSLVFKYDDYGYSFYVILKGSILVLIPNHNYHIHKPKVENEQEVEKNHNDFNLTTEMRNFLNQNFPNFKVVKEMKAGESFGELALISNAKRNATIITNEDTHFLLIGKHHYDQVLRNCNNNLLASKVELLKKVSIFNDWPFSKIIAFLQLLQEKTLNKNDFVFKENDPADFIYFIKEGEVELSFKTPSYKLDLPKDEKQSIDPGFGGKRKIPKFDHKTERIKIALLGVGAYFGSEEVIYKRNRNYKALVVSATAELFLLSKEAYSFNNHNLKLDRLFSNDIMMRNEWRKKFIHSIVDFSSKTSNTMKISPEKSYEEKIMMNYFEKRMNSPVETMQIENKSKKNNKIEKDFEKSVKNEKNNKTEKYEKLDKNEKNEEKIEKSPKNPIFSQTTTNFKLKSNRNLLKIIKSSEYNKKIYSERDSLSLVQVRILQKQQLFEKTNPWLIEKTQNFDKSQIFNKSSQSQGFCKEKYAVIDLSIEDQRTKLNELLRKRLEIYNEKKHNHIKEKSTGNIKEYMKKIEKSDFLKKIEKFHFFLDKKPTNSVNLAKNLHYRLKKSLEKAQRRKEMRSMDGDLNSCVTKISFVKKN